MKNKRIKYLKLKYLCERLGRKQCSFAKLIGVSDGQYSKRINGSAPWMLEECLIIRDVINKELLKRGEPAMYIDEIFLGEEVPVETKKPVN